MPSKVADSIGNYPRRGTGSAAIAVCEELLDANHPQLTTGMVLSAQTKELAEMRALQVYIGMHMAEASAA